MTAVWLCVQTFIEFLTLLCYFLSSTFTSTVPSSALPHLTLRTRARAASARARTHPLPPSPTFVPASPCVRAPPHGCGDARGKNAESQQRKRGKIGLAAAFWRDSRSAAQRQQILAIFAPATQRDASALLQYNRYNISIMIRALGGEKGLFPGAWHMLAVGWDSGG